MKKSIAFVFLFFLYKNSFAQLDTSNSKSIHLIHADSLIGNQNKGTNYNTLIGNVSLEHNGTSMLCDSAHLFLDQNFVEAFGNVNITTATGENIQADYLKYTGNNNTAYLNKNVSLQDGANNLHSENLIYNTKTKIGTYTQGGTLQNDQTTLTSNSGTYNGKSKDCLFTGDVFVTNPDYTVESKQLKYNTERRFVTFLDQSTIVTKETTISGKSGTYDAKNEIGQFSTRTSVQSGQQEINANQLYYNKKTGESNASGRVIINDYKEHRTLYADKTFYNDIHKYMRATGHVFIIDTAQDMYMKAGEMQYNQNLNWSMATQKPIITTLADGDSLFIKADTFFIAPCKTVDTISRKFIPTTYQGDTNTIATNKQALKTIIGLSKIKLYSYSTQSVCDSLSYSQRDSIFKLYKKPVLWTRGNQAVADTIWLRTKNNKLSEMNLKGNAFTINDTKDKTLYDQASGQYIDAYLDSSQLKEMYVNKNAETIYFVKNDKQEYEGMNRSNAAVIKLTMVNKTIDRIVFYTEPEGTFYPMNGLNENTKYLSNFKLYTERKPMSKKDLEK